MILSYAEISGSEVGQEWQHPLEETHVGLAFEQNDRMPWNKMPSSSQTSLALLSRMCGTGP